MAVQVRNDSNTKPFIFYSGPSAVVQDGAIKQDAGRVAALAPYTLLAKELSTGKYVPLTDVSPALTSAKMVCGAIGGTAPEFQAISDAEFSIIVNGETLDITGLDLTGIDTVQDSPGYYTCGANGGNIGAWNAVTDGAFDVTVDGLEYNLTAMDFSTAVTLNDVADTINYAASGEFSVLYDGKLDIYKIVSNSTGETSSVAAPNAPAAGTDISAAAFLNGAAAGSATAGTGGEALFESISEIINANAAGRFSCYFDGDAFVFVSPTAGLPSSVITVLSAVSGGAGTDISGASYLNGLTGTGTVTAATGGDAEDMPAGIYVGNSITAAALVAADYEDAQIITGDCFFDEDQLVLENSLTLASVITRSSQTVRDALRQLGLQATDSVDFSAQENT